MFSVVFRSEDLEYSNKFIVSFLKSSVWIWYCFNKFETLDLYKNLEKIIIPKINLKNLQLKEHILEIEDKVELIIR